jgi:hypothetical protein
MIINRKFYSKKTLFIAIISAIIGAYFFITKSDKILGDAFLFISLIQISIFSFLYLRNKRMQKK